MIGKGLEHEDPMKTPIENNLKQESVTEATWRVDITDICRALVVSQTESKEKTLIPKDFVNLHVKQKYEDSLPWSHSLLYVCLLRRRVLLLGYCYWQIKTGGQWSSHENDIWLLGSKANAKKLELKDDEEQSCKMSIFYTEQKFKKNLTHRKTRKLREICGLEFIELT